jgi:tRNA U34 5-methylaminomethyl-2-thiouridine-forming methyltransferase MnmC
MADTTLEIFKTDDGSDSLFNPALMEVYHSRHGAVNESKHVFIKAGLEFVSNRFDTIKILEVGFGTGLNALLTLDYCHFHKLTARYFTLEPFPIKSDTVLKLNHFKFCNLPDSKRLFEQLHLSSWNAEINLTDWFLFIKSIKGIEFAGFQPDYFNLVYFDAFAPDIQPELWTVAVFNKLYHCMEKHGVLVTYAAKGQVRRNMQAAGFSVERIQGPLGKREMLRATKI